MSEQLFRIKQKLEELKKHDKSFKVFGSEKHRYKLKPPLSYGTIKEFEKTYEINLPEEFTAFLTTIGNGGAGPFYGLESLEDMLYVDLDYKRKGELLNPAKPFTHTEKWNLIFEPTVDEDENEVEYQKQLEQFQEIYFDPAYLNGVLAICNFGCAVSLNLVVNGQEHGYIWTDDRASDAGIYPSMELGNKEKLKFLDWYELWLDKSLNELSVAHESVTIKKQWWKFWEK